MPWEGPPKVSSYSAPKFGPLVGKLFPIVMGAPFVVLIEGSEQGYFTIFSSLDKLQDCIEKFLRKMGAPIEYTVAVLKNEDLVNEVMRLGIRIMADPVVIDDHHTQWTEIVREGDLWKYIDSSSN